MSEGSNASELADRGPKRHGIGTGAQLPGPGHGIDQADGAVIQVIV